MGVCASKQANIHKPATLSHSVPLPNGKYKLEMPSLIEYHNSIPVFEVSDSLAYNFLIKLGVQQQKQKFDTSADYQSVFLFNEKCTQEVYTQLGFYLVNISRLEKVVENKKDVRVLFNFKSIWIFKDYNEDMKGFLNTLHELNIKVKQINYYPTPVSKLLDKYKLLSEIGILNSYYPLLLFNSNDILDQTKHKDESFKIYIHNNSSLDQLFEKKQASLYNSNLSVRNIVFLYQDVNFNKQKQLQEQLYNISCFSIVKNDEIDMDCIINEFIPALNKLQETHSNAVLIYSAQQSQSFQMARFSLEQYLLRGQLIFEQDVKKYLELLRSLHIQPPTIIQSQTIQQVQLNENLPQLSNRIDSIKLNYEKLFKKVKALNITESCHNVIIKLLTNIIEKPQEQKFRTISKNNKAINLNVTQYQEGKAILDQVGFVEKDEMEYTNCLEISMLKLIKSDLEVSWRRFTDSIQK